MHAAMRQPLRTAPGPPGVRSIPNASTRFTGTVARIRRLSAMPVYSSLGRPYAARTARYAPMTAQRPAPRSSAASQRLAPSELMSSIDSLPLRKYTATSKARSAPRPVRQFSAAFRTASSSAARRSSKRCSCSRPRRLADGPTAIVASDHGVDTPRSSQPSHTENAAPQPADPAGAPEWESEQLQASMTRR